jgi:hypothetical protein
VSARGGGNNVEESKEGTPFPNNNNNATMNINIANINHNN